MSSWSGSGVANTLQANEQIRIAIVKSQPEVTVSGDGILVTGEGNTPVALDLPVTIKVGRDGLVADGHAYQKLTFSSSSAVYINSKPYRGIAEVVRFDKGLLVINQLPLEEYLVGLINCEISSAWPIEAVKAQAVIARTYALNRKATRANALYHLESSVIDQVYDGCQIEDSRAQRGVKETEGEILTYGGAIIQAFYHSSCGGKTEAAENVWGASIPYLKGVDCAYCVGSPSTSWEQKLSMAEIEDKLHAAGHKINGLIDIKAGPANSRGRLKLVVLFSAKGAISLTGEQFRKAIGYGVIKSTRFTVKVVNGEAAFTGTGNGHGVGLCQWGAKQRALDGFNYSEILAYYYPGTERMKISNLN